MTGPEAMPRQALKRASSPWFLFAALASLGCGGGAVDVAGTVYLDGQPPTDGFIRLISDDGTARSVQLDQGAFEFCGAQAVPPGSYRVSVAAKEPTGRRVPNPDRPDQPMDELREFNHREEIEITNAGLAAWRIDVTKSKRRSRR